MKTTINTSYKTSHTTKNIARMKTREIRIDNINVHNAISAFTLQTADVFRAHIMCTENGGEMVYMHTLETLTTEIDRRVV